MPKKELTDYAAHTPSALQRRFADWILDKTGVQPAEEESFRQGVAIATALRMDFQASEENRQATLAEREERKAAQESGRAERERKAKEREEKAAERVAKAEERAKAAQEKAAQQLAKAEERAAALRAKANGEAVAPKPKRGKGKKAELATEETAANAGAEATTSPETGADTEGDAPW